MFGIRYMKTTPTTYVLCYRQGRLAREGAGLSFFYFAPQSTIVHVPVGSVGLPFAFQETTADFQVVTLQGQITYRVAQPKLLAGMLDLSVSAAGRYQSDDHQKIGERLIQWTQAQVRAGLQKLGLREALTSADVLGDQALAGLRQAPQVQQMGLEVMDLTVLFVRCTPEMAKAMEAETREAFQRRADEAIYQRRNAAVEQERTIKESELNTEMAVADKKQQIRRRQLDGDLEIERERAALTDQRVENERKEADSRAYALEAVLRPVRDLDWRTLMTISGGSTNANASIALAFQEMAANAQKIGEINISPDLLQSLMHGGEGRKKP